MTRIAYIALGAALVVSILCGRVGAQGLEFHGFARQDFTVDGRKCILVTPKAAAPGRPWIWRARFFGHQPQADRRLLELGYHLAYCDVAGLFGAPRAVAHWDAFYASMVETRGLAKRPALEGMSRGGLIIYSWAAANPDKVACIYGDAPVCDFKSWPGGRGEGKGSPRDWQRCLAAYELTEEAALAYRRNPIDRLAPLAETKIPILHVVGGADRVVPPAENSDVVARRYRELGGTIHVVRKKGLGHHPHSLANPRPIVEFVVGACRAAGADRTSAATGFADNLIARGDTRNARSVFETTKKGHVAFMGGSITEMNGYRPRVCAALKKRFPQTTFTFTDAGIASTGSTTGAFRLRSDVLSKGPVDLFLVEFAVNDDQDGAHDRAACMRGMEGIVRQIRRHNRCADIVVVHFINPRMRDALMRGETPPTVESHEAVAAHYGVPSVYLAREVADRILRGELTWKTFGGTHPGDAGNELAARMMTALLEREWEGPRRAEPAAHAVPEPILSNSYGFGCFLAPAAASVTGGWLLEVPEWSGLAGAKRAHFTKLPMLCATRPGAELTLDFMGTAIGAYVVAGPDAGMLEGSVDGKAFAAVDLFHRFSRGLHYPRTVMFATELGPGKHSLKLRVAKATRSKGNAARIMQFVVNSPEAWQRK